MPFTYLIFEDDLDLVVLHINLVFDAVITWQRHPRAMVYSKGAYGDTFERL